MIDWLIEHAPSARHLLVFNLCQLAFWLFIILPSILWWRESLAFLVFLSVAALVVGAIAATCASLAQLASHDERVS